MIAEECHQMSDSIQKRNGARASEDEADAARPSRQLDDTQWDWLRRAAKGDSLRFVSIDITNALVAAGYVERGVAGTFKMTLLGKRVLELDQEP